MLPDLNDPYVFFFLAAALFSISVIFSLFLEWVLFSLFFSPSLPFPFYSVEGIWLQHYLALLWFPSLGRVWVLNSSVSRVDGWSCTGPWISSGLSFAPSPGVTRRNQRSRVRALKPGNPRYRGEISVTLFCTMLIVTVYIYSSLEVISKLGI